jgi:predicted transcriptional regulator
MTNSDNIKVHIGDTRDMGKRFVAAWKKAARGEKVDETHVTFRDLEQMLSTLTPMRLRLLKYVRSHQVENVRSLAAELHRDYKNVHRDVEALARIGLLERRPKKVVAPFAEVQARFVL